jgi:methylenetetrahydrofolate dehydrogenase (NADP+) / methenyltetrahydrofolate cyclohydrolase
MGAQILDGKVVAAKIKEDLQRRINKYSRPHLGVCLVGSDPASEIYVNNKRKACDEVGIKHWFRHFSANVDSDEVIEWLEYWNQDQLPHGILVQLPLPPMCNKNTILRHIAPHKDVDCFHPENQGLLMTGQPRFLPCTPAAILEILKYYDIRPQGKNVVIVNRTIVVGQPLTSLLTQDTEWGNATVTVCHEYTKDIKKVCLDADIIITAVGKPNYRLTADMVKEGATIIDVGIFREGKKIRGDAVFEEVAQKAAFITPVPGGVGPCTVAMLLYNTMAAMEQS